MRAFLLRGLIHSIRAFGRVRGFGRWFGRGFWTVLDQGLFASSNFVLNLLLARWLIPQDYGAFTVAYTIFLLLLGLHAALLTEPLLVFGPGKYEERLSEYLSVLLYGHSALTALGSLLLVLAGLVLWLSASHTLSLAIWGLALAVPFVLFHWLMRRACYVRPKPQLAALGSALNMVLILFGIYVVYKHDWLSAAVAFGLMGLASLATGLWLAVCLRVNPPLPLADRQLVRATFKDHWGFGRWAAPTSMLGLLSGNIYFLLLPIWWGLEGSAALRALLNLALPVVHTFIALAALLIPTLVVARAHARFVSIVRLALILSTLGTTLYWVLLGLFHDPLVAWIYGGQYNEYADLLWLAGLLPIAYGMLEVLNSALRALERPDRILLANSFSILVALTIGLLFLIVTGVAGAVTGVLISQLTAVGALAWFLHTLRRRPGRVQSREDKTHSHENL